MVSNGKFLKINQIPHQKSKSSSTKSNMFEQIWANLSESEQIWKKIWFNPDKSDQIWPNSEQLIWFNLRKSELNWTKSNLEESSLLRMLPVWTSTLRPHPAFEEQDYSFRTDQLQKGNIRLGEIKHCFIFQDFRIAFYEAVLVTSKCHLEQIDCNIGIFQFASSQWCMGIAFCFKFI